jgi:hypothetical protein
MATTALVKPVVTGKRSPHVGQRQLVTVPAVEVFGEMRFEIVDGANAGDITPYRASRLAGLLIRLDDRLRFAHNRVDLASLALRDVDDLRNIEAKCLKAYIAPDLFEPAPDAA